MDEVWKDIIGFEGRYQVSNLGRVKSLERTVYRSESQHAVGGYYTIHERILIPCNSRGYQRVNLYIEHKIYIRQIHRLVAESFIGEIPENMQINHIDGIKTNNCVGNLEICTSKHNIQHAFNNGLKKPTRAWLGKFGKENPGSKPVIQLSMNGEYIREFNGLSEAQRNTGIWHICCAIKGDRPHAGGFKWKYKAS